MEVRFILVCGGVSMKWLVALFAVFALCYVAMWIVASMARRERRAKLRPILRASLSGFFRKHGFSIDPVVCPAHGAECIRVVAKNTLSATLRAQHQTVLEAEEDFRIEHRRHGAVSEVFDVSVSKMRNDEALCHRYVHIA